MLLVLKNLHKNNNAINNDDDNDQLNKAFFLFPFQQLFVPFKVMPQPRFWCPNGMGASRSICVKKQDWVNPSMEGQKKKEERKKRW